MKASDIQAKLVEGRASAERLIAELKDELYEAVYNKDHEKAVLIAERITVYKRVIEDTWPLSIEGAAPEAPEKHPWELT